MKCNCGRNEYPLDFPEVWLKKHPEIKGMCVYCFNNWQNETAEKMKVI